MAEINSLRLLERTNAHTPPRRVSARGRGVWTLAKASVECRVMSGASTAGADEACKSDQSCHTW